MHFKLRSLSPRHPFNPGTPPPKIQVRFIYHEMEKNAALISKVPSLLSLAKNLRAFVSSSGARHHDGGAGGDGGAADTCSMGTFGGGPAGSCVSGSVAMGGGGAGAGEGGEMMSVDAGRGERDARGRGGGAGAAAGGQ